MNVDIEIIMSDIIMYHLISNTVKTKKLLHS